MSDARDDEDKGFQDRLLALVEWMAKRDPVRAATLLSEYLDDLADEVGPTSEPAKG